VDEFHYCFAVINVLERRRVRGTFHQYVYIIRATFNLSQLKEGGGNNKVRLIEYGHSPVKMERVENLSDGLQQVACKSKDDKRESAKPNWRGQYGACLYPSLTLQCRVTKGTDGFNCV
jgi:hypothetical protein